MKPLVSLVLSLFLVSLFSIVFTSAEIHSFFPEQSGNFSSMNAPAYRISNVTISDQEQSMEVGKSISPILTIQNEGADDPGAEPVILDAYLDTHKLAPKINKIPPLRAGQKEEISLEYIIPEGIPPRDYQFFIRGEDPKIINSQEINGGKIRASTLISIQFVPPKIKKACNCY